jgi:tRNA A-37 threonylcarbamoyl transferase component Bud32
MAAKRKKRRSGARRRDTLERYWFPAKPKSKKVSSGAGTKAKKTSSSPKRATKKAAARGKMTGKKTAGVSKKPASRGKKVVKMAASVSKRPASRNKKVVKKAASAPGKVARAKPAAGKVSRSKPAVKKAAAKKPAAKKKAIKIKVARGKPAVKKKAAKKASAKFKPKEKTKKTPLRSMRTPQKAAARGKKVVKKAASAPGKAARVKAAAGKVSRSKPAAKKTAAKKPAAKKQAARAKPAAKKQAARAKPAAKKPAVSAAPIREKNSLDNYKIMGMIGEGGMGKIYKAVDMRTKKTVVMKQLIIAEREIFIKRFQREADIMLSLHHANIVTVYDYLKQGRSYYIIMEFVDGISLEDLIRKNHKIEPLQALLIFNELCKGLKYAHDRQIIHRDIKPNNVLISKTGQVKLVDFGIAKSLEEDEGLTKTGVVMGTPAYMSPEQLISTKYVDNLTDIYSMGVMFYQMITGQRPYGADFTAENIRKITLGEYTSPKQLNPDLPGYCLNIIKKTMHHKKEKRVQDLQELINDMSVHLRQFPSKQQVHNEIKKALAGL